MRWEKRGFQVRWATRRADVWPALSAGVTHDDEMSARLVSEMDQLEAYRRREEGSRPGPATAMSPIVRKAGGLLRTRTRPTLCSDEPCPRVCMSIHSGRKPCSDLGSSACSQ